MILSIMPKVVKDFLILISATFITVFLVWLPHFLSLQDFWGLSFAEGFNTIYRNFDGLEYIIIAKTFYNPEAIATLPQQLPANYFASHFPGYAVLIAFFAPLLGYLKSMLFVSVVSSAAATVAFYLLVRDFKLSSRPLLLSLLFLILPARWLIVRSVGSSEPVFIFFIVVTIYFFLKFEASGKIINILTASLFGLFAQFTRPPGILLFIALVFYLIWKIGKANLTPGRLLGYSTLLLIPVGLLAVFFLYSQTYGDFFAYFKSGDNIHLTFPPFQVFNKFQFWVGDIWLEDIVYIFILGFLGGAMLLKRKLYPMAFFVLTYLAAGSLVVHRDISRYLLPISPFILIAFEGVLTSREFKFILPIIFLAIYLYAQNFILGNTAPFPNLYLFD